MTKDLADELERLAKEATPGEWRPWFALRSTLRKNDVALILAFHEALPQIISALRREEWQGIETDTRGYLPIVLCPTDGVDRALLLPDGREVTGAFAPVGRPSRWRIVVENILRPAHKLEPRGGVDRWSAPYTTKVYADLPDGIVPTHFRPNDTVHALPPPPKGTDHE